ncbi:pyridoxamine 5'-phosphate oxidase family protein [Lacrimispora sp. AGF001]|uniref:pyridoxamine 5'-phosphate oxidase family protein n=1 Tax=Lacrimispora sp. AGF001 TaxID=3401631 RepID=UPI003B431D37
MNAYEEGLGVLETLFARDYQFALATSNNNIPAVRFIDTFYDNGAFYIVTSRKSNKVKEIKHNPVVSLSKDLYRFTGIARNIGHPLLKGNLKIREKLIKVFEPWYFAHNNENDENMCYIKVNLSQGLFYKDGTGYKVNFENKTAEKFPFLFDIVKID